MSFEKMMFLWGLVARLVFWAMALYIVGSSVWFSIQAGAWGMAVAKVAFFPITYFVSPFYHDQIGGLLVSIGMHAFSIYAARLSPVG